MLEIVFQYQGKSWRELRNILEGGIRSKLSTNLSKARVLWVFVHLRIVNTAKYIV